MYRRFIALLMSILLPLLAGTLTAEESKTCWSQAKADKHGVLIHTIKSPYQSGTTTVRVLLPDQLKQSKKYRVLYVLPVEAKNGTRYGDGLLEVKKLNLHNKHSLICVTPTFSDLPWYADHPKNPKLRQEAYFLQVVVPQIDRNYPSVAKREGRLLIGFSKSGWGAFSLLLRNPKIFEKAAAWDAPLHMQQPNKYGMGPIFGTQVNFEKYCISRLLKTNSKQFGKSNRLISIGYGGFREHHQKIHQLMNQLAIKHIHQDGPKRKHHFNSGWLEGAVDLLLQK